MVNSHSKIRPSESFPERFTGREGACERRELAGLGLGLVLVTNTSLPYMYMYAYVGSLKHQLTPLTNYDV